MKAPAVSLMLLLGSVLAAGTAHADAVVTVCGKDVWPGDPRVDLAEALQAGGRVTFACSGHIEFTKTHGLTRDVQIDGGGRITLDGRGRRMFGLGSYGARVSFTRIRIQGGGLAPGSIPGSVIVGEGFVSFLDGTSVVDSDRPVWLLGGDVDVRNAWFAGNAGPVLIVSEGKLRISDGSRFTDNTGELLDTGPVTNVHIEDAQFLRNGHARFGGNQAAPCEVLIRRSWFAENTTPEHGGAILSRCRLTVEQAQFERNRAGREGGAVYVTDGADASMRKVTFRDNRAGGSGGAIAGVWSLQRRGSLRIRHGRFENNEAARAGGAIYTGESSLVEIHGGAFIGNRSGTAGGAMHVRQSPLFAHGTLFRKNRASTGGAIHTLCMPPMSRISNSIIAQNVATSSGGAFEGDNIRFINATIVDNGRLPIQHRKLCGPASTIGFANTILVGGWDGACASAEPYRAFKDLGNNLQFPWQSCGTTIPVAHPVLGPFLAPLKPLSPAGNAGNDEICRAPPINGRDIYGTHRPQGDGCSIGAVEGDLTQLFDRWWKRRRARVRD